MKIVSQAFLGWARGTRFLVVPSQWDRGDLQDETFSEGLKRLVLEEYVIEQIVSDYFAVVNATP